jgi:hypothetical protein
MPKSMSFVLWCLWFFCLLTFKQRKIAVLSIQTYLLVVCPLKYASKSALLISILPFTPSPVLRYGSLPCLISLRTVCSDNPLTASVHSFTVSISTASDLTLDTCSGSLASISSLRIFTS